MYTKFFFSSKIKLAFGIIMLISLTKAYSQATFRAGDKITYADTGKADIYFTGGEIEISSMVDGDAIIAGGKIYIKEKVTEDVLLAGGQITLDAEIGDDVRVFGGQIRINKPVLGDVIIFGGDVEINKEANISGNLILFAGQLSMYSNVDGNVKINGGEIKLDGQVNGSLDANCEELNINGVVNGRSNIKANKLFIGKNASFKSDINYWTKNGEVDFGTTADNVNVIFNNLIITDIENKPGDSKKGKFGWVLFYILKVIAMALVLLVLKVFNPFFKNAANQIKDNFILSFGWGALFVLILPLVSIFLLITVIGIPLAIIGLATTGVVILISKAITSILLVHYLNNQYQKNWSGKMLFLISVSIYILLDIISMIPFLGWLISMVLVLVALGSIIIEIRSDKKAALSNRL